MLMSVLVAFSVTQFLSKRSVFEREFCMPSSYQTVQLKISRHFSTL